MSKHSSTIKNDPMRIKVKVKVQHGITRNGSLLSLSITKDCNGARQCQRDPIKSNCQCFGYLWKLMWFQIIASILFFGKRAKMTIKHSNHTVKQTSRWLNYSGLTSKVEIWIRKLVQQEKSKFNKMCSLWERDVESWKSDVESLLPNFFSKF